MRAGAHAVRVARFVRVLEVVFPASERVAPGVEEARAAVVRGERALDAAPGAAIRRRVALRAVEGAEVFAVRAALAEAVRAGVRTVDVCVPRARARDTEVVD